MEKKHFDISSVLVASVVVVGIVMFGWLLFRDISDNGRAVNAVRTELAIAREEQQQARNLAQSVGQRLDQSEAFVESVRKFHNEATGGVEIVQNRNAETAAIIRENRELIAEGRSVIDDLRKRGKADTEAK